MHTEFLSGKNKDNHKELYKQYIKDFNEISIKLDSVDRSSPGSNHSEFRQLKIDETEGFYIDVIEPGFGADNAGLQKGDIIKSVDDVKINRFSDLSGYLSSKRPGDRVSVKYIRDKQLITVSVTLKKDSN